MPPPEFIMDCRIDIRRLVGSAMYGEVGLPVALEIEPIHHDAGSRRLFIDAGGDGLSSPVDQTRMPDLYRYEFHDVRLLHLTTRCLR